MPTIHTEVVIKAPIETIWGLIHDMAGEWNPVIRSASGELVKGDTLKMVLSGPGNVPIGFKIDLLEVCEKKKQIRWLGYKGPWKMYRADHSFDLVDEGNGTTRLIQNEVSVGLPSTIGMVLWGFWTRNAFHVMDAALKSFAERNDTAAAG